MSKRGKDIEKLRAIAKELASRNPLPARFRDHPLKGDWVGFRECHVEPDWLLVYRREGATLILQRTGTHTDLFG